MFLKNHAQLQDFEAVSAETCFKNCQNRGNPSEQASHAKTSLASQIKQARQAQAKPGRFSRTTDSQANGTVRRRLVEFRVFNSQSKAKLSIQSKQASKAKQNKACK